jgi:hypothetical protein
MTDMTLSRAGIDALDRAKDVRLPGKAWPLDKIVFVMVLGVAYALSAFAIVLPIWVWVF